MSEQSLVYRLVGMSNGYANEEAELLLEAADLIDRLTERCEAYKGQAEAGAAEIERYRESAKGQLVVVNQAKQAIDTTSQLTTALTACQRVLADLIGNNKTLSSMHIYTHAVVAEAKARAALPIPDGTGDNK